MSWKKWNLLASLIVETIGIVEKTHKEYAGGEKKKAVIDAVTPFIKDKQTKDAINQLIDTAVAVNNLVTKKK
jgi:hypothetical protein